MKLLSKTFNIPIDSKQLQNKQFQQAISQLIQREQEILNHKFIKEQQTQNRIKQLQKNYQQWVHIKQSSFRHKLQKSEKNRLQIRDKLVKKCKDNNKIINQKVKIAFSKRRQSLKEAWKAANKFNDKIHSKTTKNSMILSAKQQKKDEDEAKSVDLAQQQQVSSHQNIFLSQINTSKLVSTRQVKPLQKSLQTNIFHSTFNINKSTINMLQKYVQNSKQNHQNPQQQESDKKHRFTQQNQDGLYEQKLRMTLSRHRQHVCELENRKIQQLGQRLEKIQQSRIKKQELHKSHLKRSQDFSYDNEQQKSLPKQAKKLIKQRLKSENSKLERQRRGSDWQQTNRTRRQQLQLTKLQIGNSYLSHNKIRYMKQVLAKSISYNAMEQKLYYQRLKH